MGLAARIQVVIHSSFAGLGADKGKVRVLNDASFLLLEVVLFYLEL